MDSEDFENEWWDGFAEKKIKEDVIVAADIVRKLWGEQRRNPHKKKSKSFLKMRLSEKIILWWRKCPCNLGSVFIYRFERKYTSQFEPLIVEFLDERNL